MKRKLFSALSLAVIFAMMFTSLALADDPPTPTAEPTAAPTEAPTQDRRSLRPRHPGRSDRAPPPSPPADRPPDRGPHGCAHRSAHRSPASPPPPFIQSDKADYFAGELVVLTSGNWQPGESVSLYVNDDYGSSWNLTTSLQADGTGAFSYQFNLPNWFVALYRVTATGATSGVATTTFTDSANTKVIQAQTISPITATVTAIQYDSSGNCTGSSTTLGSFALTSTLSTITTTNNASSKSVRLTAPASPTSPSLYTFSNWTSPTGGNLQSWVVTLK